MTKYIKTLQPVMVYNSHTPDATMVSTIPEGELVPYNREKLRNGIRWIEIYMSDGSLGYVKKNKNEFFICREVKLTDNWVQGFDYTVQGNVKKTMSDIFSPMQPASGLAALSGHQSNNVVEVKRMIDTEKNKSEYLQLSYNASIVTVTTFTMEEKETFYVVYENRLQKNTFMEVDNLYGKKGYLLPKTSCSDLGDEWIGYIGIAIMIITILGIIIAFFAAGWIVIGTILIIPGLILAFVAVFVLQIVMMILKGIAHEIRVRL
jgi:hypothetical protein